VGPGGIIDPTQRSLTRFVIVGMGANATVSSMRGGAPSGIGVGDVVMIPGEHVVTMNHQSRPYFVVPGSSVMMIQAKGGTPAAEDWPIMARYTQEDAEPTGILVPRTGPTGIVGPNGQPVT